MSDYSVNSPSGASLARRSSLEAAIKRRNELAKEYGSSLTITGPNGKPIQNLPPSNSTSAVRPSFLPSHAK